VKSAISGDRKAAYEKRGEAMKKAWTQSHERSRQTAACRLERRPDQRSAPDREVWAQIKDMDYSLVSSRGGIGAWPDRLFKMERHHHWLGGSGGAVSATACRRSVGAAHANNKLGGSRVVPGRRRQMFCAGRDLERARHKMSVSERAAQQQGLSQESCMCSACRTGATCRNLGRSSRTWAGLPDRNPDVNYAKLAESMGWWATPPISDPAELGPALKRAVEVVKSGQAGAGRRRFAAALRGM